MKVEDVLDFMQSTDLQDDIWDILLWIKENEPDLVYEASGELEKEMFQKMSIDEKLESLKLDIDIAVHGISKLIKD